jgi:hypothetical protein
VANTLPHLPGLELLRDVGIASYATLLLWLAAVVVLHRKPKPGFGSGSVEQGVSGGEACQIAA